MFLLFLPDVMFVCHYQFNFLRISLGCNPLDVDSGTAPAPSVLLCWDCLHNNVLNVIQPARSNEP